MRILAIDVDDLVVEFLRRTFLPAGYTVDLAADASDGRERVLVTAYSTVFVGRTGASAELVRALRVGGFVMPIVAVMPTGAVDDAVQVLDAGADDVVDFPIPDSLLAARVRAAVRRVEVQALEHLAIGDLVLNRVTHRVSRNGTPLLLTARQYALLEFLALRPGQTVLRPALLQHVWNLQFDPGSNVVDVHVAQLRKRLRDSGTTVEVRTVRGEGYALEPR